MFAKLQANGLKFLKLTASFYSVTLQYSILLFDFDKQIDPTKYLPGLIWKLILYTPQKYNPLIINWSINYEKDDDVKRFATLHSFFPRVSYSLNWYDNSFIF